jgi:glycosyltransferase involved in cell wall biosynthesis
MGKKGRDVRKTVSLIIPTISDDEWLEEAVCSALAQRGDFEMEVIVAFDGPVPESDGDWKAHPRVRIIRAPENRGIARTMNWAISHSSASFVARLDADDRCHPDRVGTQLRVLEQQPDVGVVGTLARRIGSDGKVRTTPDRSARSGATDAKVPDATVPEAALPDATVTDVTAKLFQRNQVVSSSVLIRRELLEQQGGYREDLSQMEDYELLLRLAAHTRVLVVAKTLVDYRIHSNQITRTGRLHDRFLTQITSAQRDLARQQGVGLIRRWAYSSAWLGAQYLAILGIRRRSYDR